MDLVIAPHLLVFLTLLVWVGYNAFGAFLNGDSGGIKRIIWRVKMNFQSCRIAYAKEMIGTNNDSTGYLCSEKGTFDYREVRAKGNWDEFMLAALGNLYGFWIEVAIVGLIVIKIYTHYGVI